MHDRGTTPRNRMKDNSDNWVRRALRKGGQKLFTRGRIEGTWIDVGAHHGETTLVDAYQNPRLRIYAFEPNLSAAATLMSRASNYFVIPMAIAETDGFANLNVNAFDQASSLLPFNEASLQDWIGGEDLKVKSIVTVPTIRLDTFMNLIAVQSVDYLKIDAQGMDLAVVKSAGVRLRDISRITMEVDRKPLPLYSGAASKREVMEFMSSAGFVLVSIESQTHGQEENLTFARPELAESEMTRLIVTRKTELQPFLLRLRRFLAKPWREKIDSARFRLRAAAARIPVLVRLPFGAWFLARHDNVGDAIREGNFELAETAFVSRCLRPGLTVLDVGANQGYYTLLASQLVGDAGRVIAFEPSPREMKALQIHKILNRRTNVTLAGVALGADQKEAELFIVQGHQTACNSLQPPLVLSETTPVKVQVVRLDDWLEAHKIDRVDFVKLDVEGGELEALKGAEKLLHRRPRPIFLIEVQDLRTRPWGYQAKKVIELLQGNGFRWIQLGNNGVVQDIDPHLDKFDGNFVAWPEELASGLEALRIRDRTTPNTTEKF